jgi:outer membrane protein TolC
VRWRPDLAAVRSIVGATEAERGGTIWGGLGPQLQAGYQFGGLQARAAAQDFGLREQQKAGVGGSFALGLSTFGQVKTATALQRQAATDAQRQLDQVRAQVVRAAQASTTQAKLIPIARRQVDSAQEALRLAQANLRAGTQLALDVLTAEDAVSQARVRHAQAVVRYNQSQINLLAAVGLLDSATLAGARADGENRLRP